MINQIVNIANMIATSDSLPATKEKKMIFEDNFLKLQEKKEEKEKNLFTVEFQFLFCFILTGGKILNTVFSFKIPVLIVASIGKILPQSNSVF